MPSPVKREFITETREKFVQKLTNEIVAAVEGNPGLTVVMGNCAVGWASNKEIGGIEDILRDITQAFVEVYPVVDENTGEQSISYRLDYSLGQNTLE